MAVVAVGSPGSGKAAPVEKIVTLLPKAHLSVLPGWALLPKFYTVSIIYSLSPLRAGDLWHH